MTATPAPVTTDQALWALLASLGDDADAVAATLAAAGVKGKPGRATCCPVAMWLLAMCDTASDPLVDNANIDLVVERDDTNIVELRADTPHAVDQFIGLFDSGQYPHLEQPDDGEDA